MLAGQPSRLGAVSVLLLLESPHFDDSSGTLRVSPSAVKVLNIGDSDSVVIVQGAGAGEGAAAGAPMFAPAVSSHGGDALCINALPSRRNDFRRQLLNAVGASYPGTLKLARSGKFVENPDNFSTIRLRPRDESCRITRRERPDDFSPIDSIRLVVIGTVIRHCSSRRERRSRIL